MEITCKVCYFRWDCSCRSSFILKIPTDIIWKENVLLWVASMFIKTSLMNSEFWIFLPLFFNEKNHINICNSHCVGSKHCAISSCILSDIQENENHSFTLKKKRVNFDSEETPKALENQLRITS